MRYMTVLPTARAHQARSGRIRTFRRQSIFVGAARRLHHHITAWRWAKGSLVIPLPPSRIRKAGPTDARCGTSFRATAVERRRELAAIMRDSGSQFRVSCRLEAGTSNLIVGYFCTRNYPRSPSHVHEFQSCRIRVGSGRNRRPVASHPRQPLEPPGPM